VLLYAVAGHLDRRHVARTLLFGAEFFLVWAGLRVWRGFQGCDFWQLP
jgi:hypothetical protein